MHWSEIVKQAYYLSSRDSLVTRTLYQTLRHHKELFIQLGGETYELAKSGNKTVEPYSVIIASTLREENRSLPLDLLFAKVSAIRPIKRSSLMMFLELHPRFYKSINDTYGLRGWLPPQKQHNLRTPEWLIEDPHSPAGVEKAKARDMV